MDKKERNRISYLLYWTSAILFGICIWDIYGLQVTSWPFYYPFKALTLTVFLFSGLLIQKGKIDPVIGFDCVLYYFYIYSFIGVVFLHPTYVVSFYEGLLVICFLYNGNTFRYALLTIFGLTLALLSLHIMPEPDFIKDGYTLKPHLDVLTIVFACMSFFIYWFFNRQREILYKLDQQFASIGRQSAFLLHELKSPLSRFMASSSEKDNRDAEYILSIIEGVELLISKKENVILTNFDWNNIKNYLEDEFKDICSYYNITLEISGFDGKGYGHRSAIKLAIKNLIKNAVEAIAIEKKLGTIKVRRDNYTIEVSNNGSLIKKEQIDKLFKPFYSKKDPKSHLGIGLHFVDSVVRAHNGRIKVEVVNDWNVFKLEFGTVNEA